MKALMKSEMLHLDLTSSRLQKHREADEKREERAEVPRGGGASPLQSFGQSLLQVGGSCRERELNRNAAAVVEDGGQVVSFGGGQDGQLVVGLTCWRTHMLCGAQVESGRSLDPIQLYQDSPTFQPRRDRHHVPYFYQPN